MPLQVKPLGQGHNALFTEYENPTEVLWSCSCGAESVIDFDSMDAAQADHADHVGNSH
jgi:hypothetical protein